MLVFCNLANWSQYFLSKSDSSSRYRAMTTYTLTHDVHGTKVRYQLNKTANDTKFMTIENGPRGLQGPQGPCISLCFSFTRVIRELKQQRFWAKDVKRKWTFCIIGQWFGWNSRVNRLYKRKETQQYKFVSVKADKKGERLISGWLVSLKNVFA